MEFRQLEAFVAVADRRSFSEGANYLFLSQSTVSSHIKNLERELQHQLITRSTKPLRLTPEGERFLVYARRIVETRDAALATLDQSSQTTLRLAASTIPSAYLLPQILKRFRSIHPEATYHIHQGDSADIRDQVLDGVVDLGILGQSFESARCSCIPFCTDQLVLITPATAIFRAMQTTSPDLQTLLQFPLIVREQGSGTQAASKRLLEELGIPTRHLTATIETNDLEALKWMVRRGLGVAICSHLSVMEWEQQGHVLVYPLGEKSVRQFYLACSNERTQSPLLSSLIRCILSSAAAEPPQSC